MAKSAIWCPDLINSLNEDIPDEDWEALQKPGGTRIVRTGRMAHPYAQEGNEGVSWTEINRKGSNRVYLLVHLKGEDHVYSVREFTA